jgi:hypothetical protein
MKRFGYVRTLTTVAALMSAWPAAGALPLINAPAPIGAPSITLAVTYEMELQLPEGRGLARQLIDSGIDQNDAAAAAKLGSSYMAQGKGSCSAKVAATRLPGVDTLRLTRVTLYTASKIVVMERRDGKLSVASERSSEHLSWIS